VGVIRLTIAYDGSPFAGWAAQPGRRTVQGELEEALERILGERSEVTVAGRTDAGVHAWGQVASFRLDGEAPTELARSLNAVLPDEITVLEASPAADGFDARRAARARTYCYWVVAAPVLSPFERGRALWWPHDLDRDAIDRCAGLCVGTHDFTAFTPTETEHVRFERNVLSCEWRRFPLADARDGELLELWIEADAFMRHMVRVLVGTMLEVGRGRRSVEDFAALLDGAPRERAGDTAAAHGLYLARVSY
jgi:tRNA pseudouridine38-40 synthase